LPEFKDLASDKELLEMRQRHEPILSLIHHPRIDAVMQNRDLCCGSGRSSCPT